MIYEFVTVDLKPAAVGEAVKRITAAAPQRDGSASLIGFWTTDVGRVNELVSLWTRPDEGTDSRDGLTPGGAWIEAIADLAVEMRAERFRLFPFLPEIRPGRYGKVYEMRSYLVKPHPAMRDMMELWRRSLEARLAFSPVLGAFYAVSGPLQKFVHIWPYDSADHRFDTRAKAVAAGVWPPASGASHLLRMENALLLPTAFSPLA